MNSRRLVVGKYLETVEMMILMCQLIVTKAAKNFSLKSSSKDVMLRSTRKGMW